MDQTGSTPDFNQNTQTGGPQFELAETGGWGKKCRGWINRYGSSVILPIVALAILASGIYLYATQKRQENNALAPQEEETPATVVTTTEPSTEIPAATENNTDKKIIENLAINNTPELEKVKEIVPEKKQTNTITIKAEKGEGVTHLARKAFKTYHSSHNLDSFKLTKEHKIYIEDYIKDKIGSKTLKTDETIDFSENLIKEAIDSSTKLTSKQLKVIEQFSRLVTSEI